MQRELLNWSMSATSGGVTEIAVLAPIIRGRAPGERLTYEEKLRRVIDSIQTRADRGIPHQLNTITSIHFGRMMIIRPEQYLTNSNVAGVDYFKSGETSGGPQGDFSVPKPLDEFEITVHGADGGTIETHAGSNAAHSETPGFHSWLLTIVSFDGDLKVYFRDIAQFLARDFDEVFVNCVDFPSTRDFEKFWHWIRRYQVPVDLFLCAYPDLTVVQIKQLEDFKRCFDAFVEKVRSPTGRKVENMEELFDEFLRETAQYASAFPTPGGTYRMKSGKGV
ncbi:hypothetical protein [Nitratireductor sp. XY-223]|uniref:hypothetical protein n=1 Tax=Nitratireductor sp. XY-223 TaxID=2561926 RepID=UPI0010AB0F3C|nr:hypothetical protein [Nitratireductor sp. XY-223]